MYLWDHVANSNAYSQEVRADFDRIWFSVTVFWSRSGSDISRHVSQFLPSLVLRFVSSCHQIARIPPLFFLLSYTHYHLKLHSIFHSNFRIFICIDQIILIQFVISYHSHIFISLISPLLFIIVRILVCANVDRASQIVMPLITEKSIF